MRFEWSRELEVAVHPRRGFRALGDSHAVTPAWQLWARGPMTWLTVVACVVSLTSAGRLVPLHFATSVVGWASSPLSVVVSLACVRAGLSLSCPTRSLVDLYYAGAWPTYAWLLAASAYCLFAAEVAPGFFWALESGALVASVAFVLIANVATTYAAFRYGADLSSGRAALASAGVIVGVALVHLALLAALGQLQPLMAAR